MLLSKRGFSHSIVLVGIDGKVDSCHDGSGIRIVREKHESSYPLKSPRWCFHRIQRGTGPRFRKCVVLSSDYAAIHSSLPVEHDMPHPPPCFGECEGNITSDLRVCSYQSEAISYIGWLLLSAIEVIFFGMVMWKYFEARQNRRTASPIGDTTMTYLIVRESVYYFSLYVYSIIHKVPSADYYVSVLSQYSLSDSS